MAKKRIEFMITAFRDGFQSVYGARVLTKDFLPAVEAAVEAGLTHFEAGGGARFQSLYFYCNEDAFEMMDAFRRTAGPDANLQTLARGINVVGLESQSSDIIELHAELFKKHGITTIRNFDALNDVDNLDYSGRCIVNAGLRHEICVTMMGMPPGSREAHTPEFYMTVLRNILDAGIPFDSVCFKDASGTATPGTVHDTIAQARRMLPPGTPLRFHTHETAGTSITCYRAALEAGADALDLSMAPVSGGTGQPDVAVMWHALRGTEYDLGIDIDKVLKAEEVLKECMQDYFLPPEAIRVEPMIPFSPMPGGAYTANTQMMRDNKILARFPEVIAAMKDVVALGGFGTSVTPVSQFYFQQAFNNVMFGPWERIAEGYGKMVLGYFGRTPVPPDPKIVELAAEQLGLEPTGRSPREINDEDPSKGVGAAKRLLKEAAVPITDENIFIAATCRDKGIAFLRGEAKLNIRKITPSEKCETIALDRKASPPGGPAGTGRPDGTQRRKAAYRVTVADRTYAILIDGRTITVDGTTYGIEVHGQGVEQRAQNGSSHTATGTRQTGGGSRHTGAGRTRSARSYAAAAAHHVNHEGEIAITAPMPGAIIRINVQPGDVVEGGAVLIALEAMKMETEITAPVGATVSSVEVSPHDTVSAGQTLLWLDRA
ncbi:MAG TPA: biotin/lipoyl-containing protein [Patescibacteria group bacterium]|nr:biotin/lipoyl-containing protein [Patescibacteria group bacterium]